MGIDKLPSGKWRVRINRGGVKKTGTFLTKQQAEQWEDMIRGDIFAKKIGKPIPSKTLRDAMQRYMEEVSPHKKGGAKEIIRIKKLMRDDIASVPLSKLTPDMFADWRDKALKTLAPASVRRELGMYSSVLTECILEWRWIKENPVKLIRKPSKPAPRQRRPSRDEIERLCFVADYGRHKPVNKIETRAIAAFLFGCVTGMRVGEICGLTWDRVQRDDNNGWVALILNDKNGLDRWVPLRRAALYILNQLAELGKDGKVFKLTTACVDANFRKKRDEAAIDDLHFHDSRHEGVTRWVAWGHKAGKSPLFIAKISGHKNLKIFFECYYNPNREDFGALSDKTANYERLESKPAPVLDQPTMPRKLRLVA